MEKQKKNKVLLLVDCQYDFINGSLAVPEAEPKMDALARYVEEHGGEYSTIIATVDWHPDTHCSFVKNGGEWPQHCIMHSHGAAIYQPLLESIIKHQSPIVLKKGTEEGREEYSIFKNIESAEILSAWVGSRDTEQIDVCGIAGDICVLNTVKDGLRAFPSIRFNVIKNFTPSLDSGKALTEMLKSSERYILTNLSS